MKAIRQWKFLCLGLLVVILLACAPPALSPASTPAPGPKAALRPSWEEEWEKTTSAAKKEGKLFIMASSPLPARGVREDIFRQKFSIDIDALIATPAEMMVKLEAERRQGIYRVDMVTTGATALKGPFEVMSQPIEPAFILPEVKNKEMWVEKKLPFFDKEGKVFMYLGRVGPSILINKDMVKPEELKSWRNLLEPKWKGKILMFDPSIAGAGNSLITTVGQIMGIDYLRELARQEPLINRDKRLQVEWVARAKYPIALGFDSPLMEDMRGAGAPLTHVVPAEGTYFGSGTGGITMMDRPPHPNATRVFLNWFLSQEGQGLMVKAAKEQSRRVDVKPELPPDRLFQEGIKYVDGDTEEMLGKITEMLSLTKEIFAAQYK